MNKHLATAKHYQLWTPKYVRKHVSHHGSR